MYSPDGRFITRDPIGEAGGANLYRYADNDPVNKTDTTGLAPTKVDSEAVTAGAAIGAKAVDPGWGRFVTRWEYKSLNPGLDGFQPGSIAGSPGTFVLDHRGPYIAASTKFGGSWKVGKYGKLLRPDDGRLWYVDLDAYNGELIRRGKILLDLYRLQDEGAYSAVRVREWRLAQAWEGEVLLDAPVSPFAVRPPFSVYFQRSVNVGSKALFGAAIAQTAYHLADASAQAYQLGSVGPLAAEASAQGGGWTGAIAVGKAGAFIGSAAGPVGTFIGGAVGGTIGFVGGETTGRALYIVAANWPEVRTTLAPAPGSLASLRPSVLRDMYGVSSSSNETMLRQNDPGRYWNLRARLQRSPEGSYIDYDYINAAGVRGAVRTP